MGGNGPDTIYNGAGNNLLNSQEQSQNNSHGMGTVVKMAQTPVLSNVF